ncbi:MAG: hypothetical protein KME27_17095 [Lyngbya sp. HA4199-MV5]|jgi:chromosome segregation ATPase|nr:hypothetical protein [Lyngbya sp. HA4199-MV5]
MTGQSFSDNQQLLTTLVQATVELVQLNKQYSQKLDAVETKIDTFEIKLDAVETKIDTFDIKLGTFDAKIEAIADQIGKLTESMTAFRLDLDDIKETTRQQAETAKAQAETAKAQAESVSQLIALLGRR